MKTNFDAWRHTSEACVEPVRKLDLARLVHPHWPTLRWLLLLLVVQPLTALGQANDATPYTFTTLAGFAGIGIADGTGSTAQFNRPSGLALDSATNLYVADANNCTIRKVTPAGVVTTLAGSAGNLGSADGTGSAALFGEPEGVAVDTKGNLYVADTFNSTIRKVTPTGEVTTLAGLAGTTGTNDGSGTAAHFNSPSGIAVDTNGNLYVADTFNFTIRKMTLVGTNWDVTTIAGGLAAGFYYPQSVAVDGAGNVYVADTGNATILKVTSAGAVTTLAGKAGQLGSASGTGSVARFDEPMSVALDSATNVYVADWDNHTIRKVTPSGAVTTLAGRAGTNGSVNGTGNAARFNWPGGVAVDGAGNVYVADGSVDRFNLDPQLDCAIRMVTPAGLVTTLAGQPGKPPGTDGTGSGAQFYFPQGIAVDAAGNAYVTDQDDNTLRKVSPAGVVTTLAGLAGSAGPNNGTGSAARFNYPWGVAVDGASNVYVADAGNETIRKVAPGGVVTTLAGLAGEFGSANGTGSGARFDGPDGIAVDSATNIYVADSGNDTIRKVTPQGMVTTVAGLSRSSGTNDGIGSAAQFDSPWGVAVDSATNVYVTDTYNDTIRKITPIGTNWSVTTLAGTAGIIGTNDGTGSAAQFNGPDGIAVDGTGNIYVVDSGSSKVRKITPEGVVTTLAGFYSFNSDGTGSAAEFYGPGGVAVDATGALYVADTGNSTIRRGIPASSVSPPNLQLPTLEADQFMFGISGLTNLAVQIESSIDLSEWQVVATYLLGGGSNTFVNPNPTQVGQFYVVHVR